MKPSQKTSQVITWLRFPLIMAVVMLHTYLIDKPIGGIVYVRSGQFPFFDYLEHIIRVEIANMAVPLFFLYLRFLIFLWRSIYTKYIYCKTKKAFSLTTNTLLVLEHLLYCFYCIHRDGSPWMVDREKKRC